MLSWELRWVAVRTNFGPEWGGTGFAVTGPMADWTEGCQEGIEDQAVVEMQINRE